MANNLHTFTEMVYNKESDLPHQKVTLQHITSILITCHWEVCIYTVIINEIRNLLKWHPKWQLLYGTELCTMSSPWGTCGTPGWLSRAGAGYVRNGDTEARYVGAELQEELWAHGQMFADFLWSYIEIQGIGSNQAKFWASSLKKDKLLISSTTYTNHNVRLFFLSSRGTVWTFIIIIITLCMNTNALSWQLLTSS